MQKIYLHKVNDVFPFEASSWPLDRMMEWFKRSHDGRFARYVNTVRHKDLDGKHLWTVFKLTDEAQATNELILKLGITTEVDAKELYTEMRKEIVTSC